MTLIFAANMAKQLHNKYNRKELKKLYASQVEDRTVVSFYKYIKIDQPQLFRNQLYQWFDALEVKG
ncbi:MAG: hypothetical protein WBB93_03165, partial [Saprospiraceae bacterium]